MNDRLQRVLADEFPGVFRHLGGDVDKTCMGWGITCGDGWFLILWELCSKLEPLGGVAAQVKEKFGTLRFYLVSFDGDEERWTKALAAVAEAEYWSAETCEFCGRPGRRVSPFGYVRIACPRCQP